MINTDTAARDIARRIFDDMTASKSGWVPTLAQIEFRVDAYCDDMLASPSIKEIVLIKVCTSVNHFTHC